MELVRQGNAYATIAGGMANALPQPLPRRVCQKRGSLIMPGAACRGGELLVQEWLEKAGERERKEKGEKNASRLGKKVK